MPELTDGGPWQLVGAAALITWLAVIGWFLKARLEWRDGRLVARPVFDPTRPGRPDPTSGVIGWPRPVPTPTARAVYHRTVLRLLIAGSLLTGLLYLQWRWRESINWEYWWVSLLLLAAETFAYVDLWFSAMTFWRLRRREAPPSPPEGATVDIFITCYNEPVDIVRATVRAAKAVQYPHRTYVLDDGDSAAVQAMAEEEAVGYIQRSPEWRGKPRHAKAGNISNALLITTGEFILFQDADQMPYPEILDRVLGYFRDPKVAFVQTPHWFYNAPPHDPFGAQSFIFYGPVQQGKDAYNAAFFCGSNGVFRREALMQAALADYARDSWTRVQRGLAASEEILQAAERQLPSESAPRLAPALRELQLSAREARRALSEGIPVQEITHRFQRRVRAVTRRLIRDDLDQAEANLLQTPGLDPGLLALLEDRLKDDAVAMSLADRGWSPLGAMQAVDELVVLLDLDRGNEAQPLIPFATYSVTEDMATAMRLHAMGWRSVYHHEVLARGLAPEDIPAMLSQRLRWAQGAFQMIFKESPLTYRGLTLAQRLMYFHGPLNYLGGFASLAYLIAPPAYLLFGWAAVRDYEAHTLWMFLVPYLIVNQTLYRFWSAGLPTWRCEQYGIAFFPVWIRAVWTAITNSFFGRRLGFVVTPKTRQAGSHAGYVRWQLFFLGLLNVSVVVALARVASGQETQPFNTLINAGWAIWDVVLLSVVVDALLYKPVELGDPGTAPAEAVDLSRTDAGPSQPALALATAGIVTVATREQAFNGFRPERGVDGPAGDPQGGASAGRRALDNQSGPGGDEYMVLPDMKQEPLQPGRPDSNGKAPHGAARPPEVQLQAAQELPADVQIPFDEALRAFNHRIWNASILMSRIALAEALQQVEARGQTLQEQIGFCVENGYLVRPLRQWAEEGRLSRILSSDQSHARSWGEELDAAEVIEFCDWVFKYLYVLPAQMEARREALR